MATGTRRRWSLRLFVFGLTLVVALSVGLLGCSDDNGGDSTATTAEATGDTTTATSLGETTAATVSGDFTSPARPVADVLRPSVVQIMAQGGAQGQAGEGSGVIYSSDGLIVTNNHVVTLGGDQPVQDLTVRLASGDVYQADLVGRDPRTDLALIKIDATDLPPAEFLEDLSSVAVGEYAIAIGNPLGFTGSVTLGVVSGIQRELQLAGLFTDLIQTDAPISPGNSGGALADEQARVIGINVAAIPPQTRAESIGFAIPSDLVVTVIEQLRQTGEVRYAFLGIQAVTLDPAMQQQLGTDLTQGVLVAGVGNGTPAAEAGLQQGDIIISAGGQDIADAPDLFRLLRQQSPGDTIDLTIVRDGQEQTVQVTLAEAPQPGAQGGSTQPGQGGQGG